PSEVPAGAADRPWLGGVRSGHRAGVHAVIVYESIYGNTHLIAEAIGRGLAARHEVSVVPVDEAGEETVAAADLLVVGGPTHAHGLSSHASREAAVEAAHAPETELVLDDDAEGPGLRDWFNTLGRHSGRAAAFDTRLGAPAVLTGRASKGIARRLRHHGFELVAEPESFLVTKENHLEDDQAARAEAWGTTLADSLG
ncbi:MAG: flavodoxin family protein, partial [Acidimicrobiales bacterium]